MNKINKLAYSIEEALQILPITRTRLYQAINKGEIRSVKDGRRRMVTAKALQDFLTKLERDSAKGAA